MKTHSILIVDDEQQLLDLLNAVFKKRGYTNIVTASSGKEALSLIHCSMPDLIITDVNMPVMDGFELLQEIRSISKTPVLLLTARGEIEDRIDGFELGADDYLVKPFSPKELILRVEAILKRTYPEAGQLVRLAHCTVDLKNAVVLKDGTTTPLTSKEYTIFRKLYENRGSIVTIGALCQCAVEAEWHGYETTLMTHIRHLREKIESNPSAPECIITRKGLGYKLV